MRLLITGKTRSGKSTTLHRILSHALRLDTWRGGLLLDGKGSELEAYRGLPGITYLGPQDIEAWADELERLAEGLPGRYAALQQRGLREAPPEEKRWLVVSDEVQRGTRVKGTGKRVKDALGLLAEQSAALGDVLIVVSQREPNAIPPAVRENASGRLRMLGGGYFFYQADGLPTQSGRVAYLTPEEAVARLGGGGEGLLPLGHETLPTVLGVQPTQPSKAPATLYLGEPGSGKTYALKHHPQNSAARRLYVDFAQPHRAALVSVVEHAGAIVPPKARIPDLAEIASLAIRAEPTLLLIDNLDQASAKALTTIPTLMNAAQAVALTAAAPQTPPERRKLDAFLPRCEVTELKPLRRDEARGLLWQELDRGAVQRPGAVERRVLDEAGGNPRTIVNLAHRIKRGDSRELRTVYSPAPRVNLLWLVLVVIIAFAMVARWQVDSYTVAGILFAVALVLRPLLYRSMRSDR